MNSSQLGGGGVLVRVTIVVTIVLMKHYGEKQLEEKRAYLAYTSTSLPIIWETQDRNTSRRGNWKQEVMEIPWKDASYWLVSIACSPGFLIEYRTTSYGLTPPKMGWALAQQSLIKKIPYRLVSNLIL